MPTKIDVLNDDQAFQNIVFCLHNTFDKLKDDVLLHHAYEEASNQELQILHQAYHCPLLKIYNSSLDSYDKYQGTILTTIKSVNDLTQSFKQKQQTNNQITIKEIAINMAEHDLRNIKDDDNIIHLFMLRNHSVFCHFIKILIRNMLIQDIEKEKNTTKIIQDKLNQIFEYNNNECINQQLKFYLIFLNLLYLSNIQNIEEILTHVNKQTLKNFIEISDKYLQLFHIYASESTKSIHMLCIDFGAIKNTQQQIKHYLETYYKNIQTIYSESCSLKKNRQLKTKLNNLMKAIQQNPITKDSSIIKATNICNFFTNYINFCSQINDFYLEVNLQNMSLQQSFINFIIQLSDNIQEITKKQNNILRLFLHAFLIHNNKQQLNTFLTQNIHIHKLIIQIIDLLNEDEFQIHDFAKYLIKYSHKLHNNYQKYNIPNTQHKNLFLNHHLINTFDLARAKCVQRPELHQIPIIFGKPTHAYHNIIMYPNDTDKIQLWLNNNHHKFIINNKLLTHTNQQETYEVQNLQEMFKTQLFTSKKFQEIYHVIATICHLLSATNELLKVTDTQYNKEIKKIAETYYCYSAIHIQYLIEVYGKHFSGLIPLMYKNELSDFVCICQYHPNFVQQINQLIFMQAQEHNQHFNTLVKQNISTRSEMSKILKIQEELLSISLLKTENCVRKTLSLCYGLESLPETSKINFSKKCLSIISCTTKEIIVQTTKILTQNIRKFLRIIDFNDNKKNVKQTTQEFTKDTIVTLETTSQKLSQNHNKITKILLNEFIILWNLLNSEIINNNHKKNCKYNVQHDEFTKNIELVHKVAINTFLDKLSLMCKCLQCGYFESTEISIITAIKKITNQKNKFTYLDFEAIVYHFLQINPKSTIIESSETHQMICTKNLEKFIHKFCKANLENFQNKFKNTLQIPNLGFETRLKIIGNCEGLETLISERIRNLCIEIQCYPKWRIRNLKKTNTNKWKYYIPDKSDLTIVDNYCPGLFHTQFNKGYFQDFYYNFKEAIQRLNKILNLITQKYLELEQTKTTHSQILQEQEKIDKEISQIEQKINDQIQIIKKNKNQTLLQSKIKKHEIIPPTLSQIPEEKFIQHTYKECTKECSKIIFSNLSNFKNKNKSKIQISTINSLQNTKLVHQYEQKIEQHKNIQLMHLDCLKVNFKSKLKQKKQYKKNKSQHKSQSCYTKKIILKKQQHKQIKNKNKVNKIKPTNTKVNTVKLTQKQIFSTQIIPIIPTITTTQTIQEIPVQIAIPTTSNQLDIISCLAKINPLKTIQTIAKQDKFSLHHKTISKTETETETKIKTEAKTKTTSQKLETTQKKYCWFPTIHNLKLQCSKLKKPIHLTKISHNSSINKPKQKLKQQYKKLITQIPHKHKQKSLSLQQLKKLHKINKQLKHNKKQIKSKNKQNSKSKQKKIHIPQDTTENLQKTTSKIHSSTMQQTLISNIQTLISNIQNILFSKIFLFIFFGTITSLLINYVYNKIYNIFNFIKEKIKLSKNILENKLKNYWIQLYGLFVN